MESSQRAKRGVWTWHSSRAVRTVSLCCRKYENDCCSDTVGHQPIPAKRKHKRVVCRDSVSCWKLELDSTCCKVVVQWWSSHSIPLNLATKGTFRLCTSCASWTSKNWAFFLGCIESRCQCIHHSTTIRPPGSHNGCTLRLELKVWNEQLNNRV